MRQFWIISVAVLLCNIGFAQSIDEILGSIEQNNVALKARRELVNAQTLAAKVGNSLANPTVSFDHKWGGESSQTQKSGEMKVIQSFDFPTAYARRGDLARELATKYGQEYELSRQQILLQAKLEYISLTSLYQLIGIESKRLRQVRQVADNYEKRLASGDANVIEKKRSDIELVSMQRVYETTKEQITATELRLQTLNGGVPLKLSDEAKCTYLSADVLPFEQMLALYEKSDPQMKLLSTEVAVAGKDVRVSRTESLPKFELGYRYDFAPGERFNGIVAGVSIPMFGNRHNVKRARAGEQYAKTELQSRLMDLQTNLRELYARREMLHRNINNFNITQDDHAYLLEKALEAGQMSITDYFAEMNVYYTLFEELVTMTRDYNTVCAQIDAVRL